MNKRIQVCELEFYNGGKTIWVHGPDGGTVLRIKCTGRIKIDKGCTNICPHSDMMVQGDINICMPPTKSKKSVSKRERLPMIIMDRVEEAARENIELSGPEAFRDVPSESLKEALVFYAGIGAKVSFDILKNTNA